MSFIVKGAFNKKQANEQTLNLWGLITNQEGVLYGLNVTPEAVPSLSVNVTAGFGLINGNNTFQRYPFINETSQLLGFSSPPISGQSRNDLVVVEFTRVSSSETNGVITVIGGTAAATGSQVDPNLVETGSLFYFVLARITIIGASSQITGSQITQTGSSTRPGHVNTFATSATVYPIHQDSFISSGYQQAGRFLENTGGAMTGNLSFDSTTIPGLRLNNLTTTQRNALGIVPIGSSIFNITTGSNDIYATTGWVQGLTQKQINATKIFVEQNFS